MWKQAGCPVCKQVSNRKMIKTFYIRKNGQFIPYGLIYTKCGHIEWKDSVKGAAV